MTHLMPTPWARCPCCRTEKLRVRNEEELRVKLAERSATLAAWREAVALVIVRVRQRQLCAVKGLEA